MEIQEPFYLKVDGLNIVSQDDDLMVPRPIIRLASELKEFLKDPDAVNPNDPVLSVYRGLNLRVDEKLFSDVRYDLTILLPGRLGSEKNKTLSHYHNDFITGLSYPEIYEVLSGVGHFLLQKPPERGGPEAVLFEVKKGQGILIPPNYGHLAINPGEDTLVYSNLICKRVEPSLEEFRKRKGAVFYELYDGSFEKNPNYDWDVKLTKRGGDASMSKIYQKFRDNPQNFSYLCNPSSLGNVKL